MSLATLLPESTKRIEVWQEKHRISLAYHLTYYESLPQVDDFALAEDSPGAAGAASPAVPHQRRSAQALGPPDLHAQPGSTDAGATSAYTAQWLDTVPEPAAEARPALAPQPDHSTVCAPQRNQAADAVSDEDIMASQQDTTGHPRPELVEANVDVLEEAAVNKPKLPDDAPAAAERMTEQRRLSLTAPEEDVSEGEPPTCPSPTRTLRCHHGPPEAPLLG